MNKNICNLEAWEEITRGLFRYIAVDAGVYYEIYVLNHTDDRGILRANASLYVVGSRTNRDGKRFFERECLLEKAPVMACLGRALEDYEENYE